jgi:hypothetical protein
MYSQISLTLEVGNFPFIISLNDACKPSSVSPPSVRMREVPAFLDVPSINAHTTWINQKLVYARAIIHDFVCLFEAAPYRSSL